MLDVVRPVEIIQQQHERAVRRQGGEEIEDLLKEGRLALGRDDPTPYPASWVGGSAPSTRPGDSVR